MRYEVWVGQPGDEEVRVYASDVEAEVRIVVDGGDVFHLSATPQIESPPEEGFGRVITGYTAEASYVSSSGKEHKVLDKQWDTS